MAPIPGGPSVPRFLSRVWGPGEFFSASFLHFQVTVAVGTIELGYVFITLPLGPSTQPADGTVTGEASGGRACVGPYGIEPDPCRIGVSTRRGGRARGYPRAAVRSGAGGNAGGSPGGSAILCGSRC